MEGCLKEQFPIRKINTFRNYKCTIEYTHETEGENMMVKKFKI